MNKPYWERKNFQSYKQIKVLQPALETPVLEYIDIKIKEQEKRLISSAICLKKSLKAVDQLPDNAIQRDIPDV